VKSIYRYLYRFVNHDKVDRKYLDELELSAADSNHLEQKAYVLKSIIWTSAIFESLRRYTYSKDNKKIQGFKDHRTSLITGYESGVGVFAKMGDFIDRAIHRYLRNLLCYEGYKLSEMDGFAFGINSGVVGLLLGEDSDILDKKNPLYSYRKKIRDSSGFVESLKVFDIGLLRRNRKVFSIKKLNIQLKKINSLLSSNQTGTSDPRIILLNQDIPQYFLPQLDYETLGNLVIFYAFKNTQIDAIGLKDRRKKRSYLMTIREFNKRHSTELSSRKARFILSAFYKNTSTPLTPLGRMRILLFVHHHFNKVFRNKDYQNIIDFIHSKGFNITVGEVQRNLSEIFLNSRKNEKKSKFFD
jgi:hypothetical protein